MNQDFAQDDADEALDRCLSAAFRIARPLRPPDDFLPKTMRAVAAEQLPADRVSLRRLWMAALGWVALLVATGATVDGAIGLLPVARAAEELATRVGEAVAILSRWLVLPLTVTDARVGAGVAVVDTVTPGQTATALVALAAIGLSLSALHRLLARASMD